MTEKSGKTHMKELTKDMRLSQALWYFNFHEKLDDKSKITSPFLTLLKCLCYCTTKI